MDEEGFKKTRLKKKEKRRGTHQPLYGTWYYMGGRLHAETGCRTVYAGKVFQ